MRGDEFCDILLRQLDAKNDSDLARKLGYSPAHLSNTRKSKSVSAKSVETFLQRVLRHRAGLILLNAVHPIVKFFEIEHSLTKSEKTVRLFEKTDHPELSDVLSRARGIYAFYNSEGEIVYVGKAEKQNLLSEMTSSYNRVRPSYRMMYVRHPTKAKPNQNNNVRQIVPGQAGLWHTCSYFSAYEIQGDLINTLESFLIRTIPNDVINVKMEKGKTKVALSKWQNS